MRQSWRGKRAPSADERNDVSEQRRSLRACVSCSVLGCSASACGPLLTAGLPALAVTSARGAGCPAGARFTPQRYLLKEAHLFGVFSAVPCV